MKRHTKIFALGLCVVLGLLTTADGYPTYRNYIPNGCNVPNPCNTSQVWCGVGHESKYGGGTRNPFGRDFAANNHVSYF
jgi:hypothetical protein